jgi:RNA polymerase sigma-70 factor (ECF subfamily)
MKTLPPNSDDHYNDWREDATPTSLWDRVLDGDSLAWEKIVDVWTPCIFEYCRRKGIQKADAGDVVQQVMIRVFRYQENFSKQQKGHRLKAWLLMIIKQVIADYYRQFAGKNLAIGGTGIADQLKNAPDLLNAPDSIDDVDNSQELFDPGLWMAKTLEMIQKEVTEQTWQIFELFKIQNLSAKEVGQRFDMKETTVRQRAHTVTQRIKREADGLFDSEPEFST